MITAPKNDNAFALAVAVMQERVRNLSEEDRNDLYTVMKGLLSPDDEVQESAKVAMFEIIDQHPGRIVHELDDDETDELDGWLQFVSQRIKDARTEKGMTQAQLADKAELPQSHISRLENGQHSPTRMTLEKIARATGKELSYFDPSA